MDYSLILPLAFALGIFLIGFAFASEDKDITNTRVKEIASSKELAIKRKIDPDNERRKKMMGNLKELEYKEKQMRKARLSLSSQIEQAGLNISDTTFWLMSLGAGLAAAAVVMILRAPLHFAGGAAVAAGLGLPRWILIILKKMRQGKFSEEFASAIEVIVRGVKSGLPLMECLKMIGREAGEPLAGEFRRVVDQTAMGVPLGQALEKFYERMPLPEVSFFTIVLAIQQKAGGNLSEALGNLSTVLRSRKLMREKVKALSSEAKASAGIIASLPVAVCIMVGITTPNYIKLLFTDPTGHFMLMIGAGMMASGIFVMRKMINFEM